MVHRSKHVLSKSRSSHNKAKSHNHVSIAILLNLFIPGLGSLIHGKLVGIPQLLLVGLSVFMIISDLFPWFIWVGSALYVLDVLWAFYTSIHCFHELYPHK